MEELEEIAIQYAQEAVNLDRRGKKGRAIEAYQRAIESLQRLAYIHPNYELNRIYIQRAKVYKTRIKALKGVRFDASKISVKEYEDRDLDEVILKDSPNVRWEDVVGLEDAKKAIKEAVVYPSMRPDLFPLGWPRGILLFGPPGCGKTLLAAAVATEIEATFISIDAASVMSKWLGEAEQNVARIFDLARKSAKEVPSIIFIDELDSLMGVHYSEVGGEMRVRNQFLKEMDSIMDKKKLFQVYVIGSTNKPWTLDLPFIRRFQKRIYVPPPNYNERLGMFKLFTKCLNLNSSVDLGKLAKLTQGFSGSDILDICQSVQLKVNSELFESGKAVNKNAKPRRLEMHDFLEAIKKRNPSIPAPALDRYEKWFKAFRAL